MVEAPQERDKNCTNIILSSSGEAVETFETQNDDFRLDPHSFEIVDNDRKIVQLGWIYHDEEDGEIEEAAFQEVDISTSKVEFEWRSLDHVSRNQSLVSLNVPDYL